MKQKGIDTMMFLEDAQLFLNELNDMLSMPTIDNLFNHLSKEEQENSKSSWRLLCEKKINRNTINENTEIIDIYRHGSAYTVLINQIILPLLLQKRGMQYSNEYYRIDVIGYKNGLKNDLKEKGKELKLTPYCWEFRYAIEHENNIGEWIDEAIKLAYIKCPYKIIIGYNRPVDEEKGERNSLDLNKKCFNYLFECLDRSHVPKKDNKLIIFFGIRNKKGAWDKIQYEGYVVDYCEKKVYDLRDLKNFALK